MRKKEVVGEKKAGESLPNMISIVQFLCQNIKMTLETQAQWQYTPCIEVFPLIQRKNVNNSFMSTGV